MPVLSRMKPADEVGVMLGSRVFHRINAGFTRVHLACNWNRTPELTIRRQQAQKHRGLRPCMSCWSGYEAAH